jgi:hypothetical protein
MDHPRLLRRHDVANAGWRPGGADGARGLGLQRQPLEVADGARILSGDPHFVRIPLARRSSRPPDDGRKSPSPVGGTSQAAIFSHSSAQAMQAWAQR